jgi:hypothetical protein
VRRENAVLLFEDNEPLPPPPLLVFRSKGLNRFKGGLPLLLLLLCIGVSVIDAPG